MSRHGRIRYFGSYSSPRQENDDDFKQETENKDQGSNLKIHSINPDRQLEQVPNRQQDKSQCVQKNKTEDLKQDKVSENQLDTLKDLQQDKVPEKQQDNDLLDVLCDSSKDGQQSCIIRRKRLYSEVEQDESLEEPKLPGQTINPGSTCCTDNCAKSLDRNKIKQELKAEFVTGSKLLTRNKLLSHLIGQEKVGMRTDCFNWKGNFFCVETFSELAGQSEYTIKKVLHSHTLGKTEFVHGNSGYQKFSERTMRFKVWMRAFLERNSQSAPDSQVQVLAHWVTKNALYDMYKKDTAGPHLALSTFRQYLKSHFGPYRHDQSEPQIRFSRYSSHSVCEQCCAFNASRITCRNKEDLKKINSLKMRHFELVGGARQKMEEIKQSSIQFPDDSVVIQIDGMDNSKSYCPRMKEKSKKFVGLL